MAFSAGRIAAVAVADARSRLRRPAVAVLLAVAAVGASLLIPDPRTGGALMRIGDARALYTSSALAVGTASMVPLFVCLFGFYVVSNALARDVETRTGFLVAATPVTNLEYLAGKFLGNVALLGAVTTGFMVSGMAMQAVRGEGPVQPLVWLSNYAVLALPSVFSIAALALVFESVPLLAGRAGDLVFFVCFTLSIPASVEFWKDRPSGRFHPGWLFDFTGLAFLLEQVKAITGSDNFSLGNSKRAVETAAPVLFPGLDFSTPQLLHRAASLALPLALLLVALVFFRRFDPAKLKAKGARRSWLGLAETLARQVSDRILALANRLRPEAPLAGPSATERLFADVALTFRLSPLLVLFAIVVAALSAGLPASSVRQGLLPVLFALLPLFLADVPTRDARSGAEGLVFSAPATRARFVPWKLGSMLLSGLALTAAPALAMAAGREKPGAWLSVLLGTFAAAAFALLFGVATGTPKTFLAVFLALWYVVLNDNGTAPGLDAFGFWGTATASVRLGWFAAAAGAVALAAVAHAWRSRRLEG